MSLMHHLRPSQFAPGPTEVGYAPIGDIRIAEEHRYSITSSALAEKVGGISSPSTFGSSEVITGSNLVGSSALIFLSRGSSAIPAAFARA